MNASNHSGLHAWHGGSAHAHLAYSVVLPEITRKEINISGLLRFSFKSIVGRKQNQQYRFHSEERVKTLSLPPAAAGFLPIKGAPIIVSKYRQQWTDPLKHVTFPLLYQVNKNLYLCFSLLALKKKKTVCCLLTDFKRNSLPDSEIVETTSASYLVDPCERF